jgi:hypothetical protein
MTSPLAFRLHVLARPLPYPIPLALSALILMTMAQCDVPARGKNSPLPPLPPVLT